MTLPAPFDEAVWCQALNLPERVALWRRGGARPISQPAPRVERWRAQRPFEDAELFASRLRADGIDPAEFAAAASQSAEELAAALALGEPPDWLGDLASAYTTPQPATEWSRDVERQPEWRLLDWVAPLIAQGAARLQAGAQRLCARDADAPFEPQTAVRLLGPAIDRRVLEALHKAAVLELNVARLQGELAGDTPEQRFRSFTERLAQPALALALLREYPALARQVVELVARWVRCSLEFLDHLCRDQALLRERLAGGRALGRLQAIEDEAGDTHRGGRSVQIVAFDSGLKVVYKPRALHVERHFQELLLWLNARGDHPTLRTLEVLECGDHGWVEFVAARDCESAAAVERFYERQGGYLALLYALEANDFHYQNVLASGEQPVLVDLESLFQQRILAFDLERAGAQASALISYSVIRTGLLPQFMTASEDGAWLDVSGLGASDEQVNVTARAAADAVGTDEMRLVRKEVRFLGGRNRPTLHGQAQSALPWSAAIMRGFESVYRTLLRTRDELLQPGGPVAAFAGDDVRVILRHTRVYKKLLMDAAHPDLLHDALARDQYFDRVWNGARERPALLHVAGSEVRELRALDVPLFTTRPGSRELASAAGLRVTDFFAATGLELVVQRLGLMCERDLERQRWMIHACLSALAGPRTARPRSAALDTLDPAERPRLLAAAGRIGERLADLALVDARGHASWVGIAGSDERSLVPSPLGPDLYGGLPGVALFLAYLGALTAEARFTELADGAWRTVQEQLAESDPRDCELGAFIGLAGVAYTALHLGGLWARPELLREAERLGTDVAQRIGADTRYDVIGGAAGCIPVWLALARHTSDERALVWAQRCGQRLLDTGTAVAGGLAWVSEQAGGRFLSGFSHGGAGFAWSLLHLAQVTHEPRFRQAALGALTHERTLFDPAQRNWRDLRSFLGPAGGFNVAWCNGASGVGLSRLDVLEHLAGDPRADEVRADVEHALATTLRAGLPLDHSLCHGATGNLEFLAEAGRRLGREELLRLAGQGASAVCDEVEAGRFHCGVPGDVETPGLMNGLAGIGFGLLRAALPERVPSVLLLEAPRAAGAPVAARVSAAEVRA